MKHPAWSDLNRLVPYIPVPGSGWLGLLQAHAMNAAVLFLYFGAAALAWKLIA